MIDASEMQPVSGRKFCFACRQTLPCFTRCCADLELVLTPYDIIRLKNRLHLSSGAFLDRHATVSTDRLSGLPMVKLKMQTDETRRCPFVSPGGCVIYEDRPGACRLYPLGRAASKISKSRSGEYYFTVKEAHCLGWQEAKEWTIQAWLADQGMDEYNTMNDSFTDITTGKLSKRLRTLSHQQLKMYFMACYDLDAFRRFVFESSFLERFDIAEESLDRIRTDDIELMMFACRWLKFSLFGEMTLQINRRRR
jgi:Fe-S-cluster containining protein